MSIRRFITAFIAATALTGATAFAETKSDPGADVQMVVTVADHTNHRPGFLNPGGLTMTDGTIADVIALKDRELEVFIVIDDSANANDDFSSRLQELRHFVVAQPDAVSIGVAYIHDGLLQVVENPTTDHGLAAAALRAPAGIEPASPYSALSDLIQHWERKSVSREIVLVGTQIDESGSEGGSGANAETAIQVAQRAGVVVYALHSPFTSDAPQKLASLEAPAIVDLGQLASRSGGEAYFIGNRPTETFEPFLADISEHLANRYLVKLRLAPNMGSGLQTVDVSAGSANQELMAPEKVWVPEFTALSGQ